MNNKRFWLACVVMVIYVFVYEWVLHGGLLSGIYQSTPQVWRPQESMPAFMPWMMAGQVLFACVFCWLFTCTTCPSTVKGGAMYGLVVGLLMSAVSLIYYAVLPISLTLLIYWVIGGVLETVIAGIILSRIYPKGDD